MLAEIFSCMLKVLGSRLSCQPFRAHRYPPPPALTWGPGPVCHLGTCRHVVDMACVLQTTLVGRLSSEATPKAGHLSRDHRVCFTNFLLPSSNTWQEGEPASGSSLLHLFVSGGSMCQDPHVDSRGRLCGINLFFHLYMDSCDQTQGPRLVWQSP